MLNENDNLAWLPAETAAAMRDLASTVTDAPPLRLTADATGLAPARPRRRARGLRFRWSWGAPLLAAVAVVALAVTLVTVKDMPNGRVAPPATPTATPASGLPEYYVALHGVSGSGGLPNGLIVGGTRTGKTVTVIAPPAGIIFVSVTGAADDRTFVVAAALPTGGPGINFGFYLLTITPGDSPAARLARLPIEPQPRLMATALSASGKELAVATTTQTVPEVRKLTIYSVATGRPLRSWLTISNAAIVSDVVPGAQIGPFTTQYPALSWVNGDRAVAFPVVVQTFEKSAPYSLEVRSVSVTAAAGDLMAESTVMANLGPGPGNGPCGTFFPVLSGNGTTLFCTMSDGSDGHTGPTTVRWVLEWRPGQTSLANGAEWRSFPYIKTIGVPTGSIVDPVTLWSSSTGARLLIEWSVTTTSPRVAHGPVRFGELTLGRNEWTFTPLPAPAVFAVGRSAPSIAW